MTEYKPVPLSRRVWLLNAIEDFRNDLTINQRQRLLDKLAAMTWTEWMEWFSSEISSISHYLLGSKVERQKSLKLSESESLLLHHGAMFLLGLNEIAKDNGLPLGSYKHMSDKLSYEITAMAAYLRSWEDIDMHIECSLYWLFDEPASNKQMPFTDAD
jgi:hypothetical protein